MLALVTAVVKPHVIEDVKEALDGVGATGMTVTEVAGYGRQRGHTETYRGAEYQISFTPKVRVEVVVPLETAERVAAAIIGAARTGFIGDGKIWITEVSRLYRVRTGEAGTDAL